ncbi:hypothetical protein KUCAC02_035404, partial [Chaenocephalus aceratus]
LGPTCGETVGVERGGQPAAVCTSTTRIVIGRPNHRGTGLSWIHQYVCGRPLSSTSVFLLAYRLEVDEGSGSPSNEAYGDIDLCFSRSKDLKGTGDTVKGTISDPGFKGYVYYNWDFALAFERIAYNDIKLSKAADLSEPQHERAKS